MKEKREKTTRKPQTIKEQISLTLVSNIFWVVISVIWIGLGIAKIVSGDDWWIIALDFFVGVLSVVDAILGFIRLKKLKAAVKSGDYEKNGEE